MLIRMHIRALALLNPRLDQSGGLESPAPIEELLMCHKVNLALLRNAQLHCV